MDKLIIDIETKNTFADVGGRNNIDALEASFVGVYSYDKNEYFSFFETDFAALGRLLQHAGLVIGFSINRFDIPVMAKYFESGKFSSGTHFNIWALERYDLLDEIETNLGFRVSLDILAKENLGIGKTHHGLEAVEFYKTGNFEELKNYCLHDVRITKDLYDMARKQGHLMIPPKPGHSDEKIKAMFNNKDLSLPATLF